MPYLQYEHYDIKVNESDRFIWYANSSGYFYKVVKSTKKVIQLHGYMKDGDFIIKMGTKTFMAKHLIASKFYKKYYQGICIELIDGNPKNVSITNMRFYSMKTHGKRTGYLAKSKSVVIFRIGHEPVHYRSVRAAAKALYCSYQTLSDYLNGKVKKSVITEMCGARYV